MEVRQAGTHPMPSWLSWTGLGTQGYSQRKSLAAVISHCCVFITLHAAPRKGAATVPSERPFDVPPDDIWSLRSWGSTVGMILKCPHRIAVIAS